MARIALLVFQKLRQIRVPIPDGQRVFVEEKSSQDLQWIGFATIVLTLPELIIAVERRHTTGNTNSGAGQDSYTLAVNQLLRSIWSGNLLCLVLIVFRLLETSTKQEG